ncbi:hypothetical protein L7B14_004271 [Salmonella enterica]|nr:hypothetical protein [Salmonella enterica]
MTIETILRVGDYEICNVCNSTIHIRLNGDFCRDVTGDPLVRALIQRVQQLEQAFTTPTPDMVQAGLAEVQRMLDDWDADGHITLGSCNDPVSDDQASDMAVFVLQAMAGKLPKAGE